MRPGGGKFAFCEGRYIAGAPDDCEHFRPKGAVTEGRKKLDSHRGYFWLAYEWQNLLLACRNCNTCSYETGETHPGKLNEFPVGPKGTRIAEPCDDCSQVGRN